MIGIYKITNLINGKSYVGQSVHIERRWQEHCRAGKRSLIGQAIEKYGKEKFSFQVLEECEAELLDEKEEYYIAKCNSVVPNGYNIMDWVDGRPTYYFNTDQDTIISIIDDIKNSSFTFNEIAEKYDLSRRTITRINLGETHKLKDYEYPLRKIRVAE